MGPRRRLEEMERRRRRGREEPRLEGSSPEMRPGKMMSSVRELRLEMEGWRVPPRPGESVRPVPRVRTETRRRLMLSSGEQVMPEKLMQGSEEKSQEEKKVEPGRSKRF